MRGGSWLRAAALCTAWLPGWAQAESHASWAWIRERIALGSVLEFDASLQTRDAHAQSLRITLQPELEVALPRDMLLTAITRMRLDAFDRLEPGSRTQHAVSKLSRRVDIGSQAEIELRELYVEASVGRAYLTVGKQQVVWGKSDGLKVLDVVNPQDFREFILDDFESSRIPLWTFNLEVPVRSATVQLLWIPDPTYHELAEPDAVFALTTPRFAPRPPPGVPVVVQTPDRPRRLLSDSDAGVRVSSFWRGWDLTANYFYHYDDVVIPFRTTPTALGEPVVVTPRWKRTHTLGGSFSRAYGDLVMRGEAAYASPRYLSTTDLTQPDGVAKTSELSYVLGLDWYGIRETLLSLQVFQSWLRTDPDGVARDELDTNTTLLIRRDLLQDTLTLGVIWIHSVNDGDGLLRPRVSYEIRDGIDLEAGLDLFYGRTEGVFGEFDSRDRLTLRIRWSR